MEALKTALRSQSRSGGTSQSIPAAFVVSRGVEDIHGEYSRA
jgi:hypothetical protein